MTKRYGKLFGLFLVVCLVLGLAGCGNESTTAGADSQQTVSDTAEAATESAAGALEATTEAAAQQQVEATEAATEQQEEVTKAAMPENQLEKTVLIAYFSATGNTEAVAENLMIATGADLYKIVPEEPYTDADLDYENDQSRAALEMNDPDARPAIGGEPLSLEGYEIVYLGYPIWYGEAPRIMSTFVEEHDFNGITVIPFCTSGGSDIGNSADILEEQAGGGSWVEGKRFDSDVTYEELEEWIGVSE